MTKNEKILRGAVLSLSSSKNWEDALEEWEMTMDGDITGKCSCSKRIVHHMFIIHKKSEHTLTIGTTCIKKFMQNVEGVPEMEDLFKLLQSKKENYELLISTIKYLRKINVINDWEKEFLLSLKKFKKKSSKQKDICININTKIRKFVHYKMVKNEKN